MAINIAKKPIRNMSPPDSAATSHEIILEQLALVEQQIHELMQEKMALQRLLLKARRGDLSLKDVSRKNSVDRILIEDRIVGRLSVARRSISAADLLKTAKEIKPDLNGNTFRSYLKRMADRGLIENGRRRGQWELAKPKPNLQVVGKGDQG